MKYAIIEIGGKQLLVEEGKFYATNLLPHAEGSTLSLQRVLLCNDKGRRIIGHPYINDPVEVKATVLEHFKAPKVIIFKMRPKKKSRWTRGHRQLQTRIMIDSIQTKSI